MFARVLVVAVTLALAAASCAPRDVAARCELHDRPLVVRRTAVDTATYCGVPIEGYDEARAARFPNAFDRPTFGEHGAPAEVEHCLACTLARAAWRDGLWNITLPAERDGYVDVRRTVAVDTRRVSDALDVMLLARDAPVVARRFDGVDGYVRLGDADRGVTEIWWDDGLAAGSTDVAVRTSPHDEERALELLDALEAELAWIIHENLLRPRPALAGCVEVRFPILNGETTPPPVGNRSSPCQQGPDAPSRRSS